MWRMAEGQKRSGGRNSNAVLRERSEGQGRIRVGPGDEQEGIPGREAEGAEPASDASIIWQIDHSDFLHLSFLKTPFAAFVFLPRYLDTATFPRLPDSSISVCLERAHCHFLGSGTLKVHFGVSGKAAIRTYILGRSSGLDNKRGRGGDRKNNHFMGTSPHSV